jgi:DNA polymerase III delta prime subunit
MDLVEKYRPKTYEEFIGDKEVLKTVEEYVSNNIPVILYGKPGVGKTTMAYLIAKKLNLTVHETNASDQRRTEDLRELEKNMTRKGFEKSLFLIDEIDGMQTETIFQEKIEKMVKNSVHPVVLTANDNMKISLPLKRHCKLVEIKITPFYLQRICDRIKYIAEKEGLKPNFRKVSLDIRSCLNTVFENSDIYEEEKNSFEKITLIFKENKIEPILDLKKNDKTFYWVLDNIPNFYFGLDVYRAMKTLEIASQSGDINLLECLPTSKKGSAKYPYFLRRRSSDGSNR